MRRKAIDPQQTLPLSTGGDAREAYSRIRNFLAGRLVGATRDEALVEEVVKCIFCRAMAVHDGARIPDDPIDLAKFYRTQFTKVKTSLHDVFEMGAEILLDPPSLRYVNQQLRDIDFQDPLTDPIGDAYETFIGSATRGAEGQFFTPQSAVRLLVDLVDPKPGDRVIDPACGAGGFISYTARRLTRQGMSPSEITRDLVGIDKDQYLARLAKAHVGLVTLGEARIYCGDSLAWIPSDGGRMLPSDEIGTFDIVLANPPFGARIVAASEDVQRTFALGYSWKRDREDRWHKTTQLQSHVSPQILFVERLLSLVRPGGRVGVVLPESLISGKSYRHVVQYMRDTSYLHAVIGMPEDLFKTSGKGGTHTKVCLLLLEKKPDARRACEPVVFMAEAQWCGNDSRGRAIGRDELPEIGRRFRSFVAGCLDGHSQLGYAVKPSSISDNVLAPRYYDPEVYAILERLSETHDLVSIQKLLDDGVLEISTGHEVGKLAYGGGTIPFVRTSDISNWEVKLDPKHCVSDEVYEMLAPKQDVRAGDILMVRDGTYLIGTCAFVTEYDTRIVFQSHLYKLRVKQPEKLSPYLLLAAIGSDPVQKQIQAKRFTQDIIDSLGDRIRELVLPLPKDADTRHRIAETVERSIKERVESRELARKACLDIVRMLDRAEAVA
ncbi:MAG: N-6 DNA methylase [Deltaproteobacteria bacterium]|nr:N-6 DNA methylase [Deltaproteobacteria bacterium]